MYARYLSFAPLDPSSLFCILKTDPHLWASEPSDCWEMRRREEEEVRIFLALVCSLRELSGWLLSTGLFHTALRLLDSGMGSLPLSLWA